MPAESKSGQRPRHAAPPSASIPSTVIVLIIRDLYWCHYTGYWTSMHSRRPASKLTPRPTVISLFSGAMGLDLGFDSAGFDIRVAVEWDECAARTIRLNRPRTPIIQEDIRQVTTASLLRKAGLAPGGASVVV